MGDPIVCRVCGTELPERGAACPRCSPLSSVRRRYQRQAIFAFSLMVAGYGVTLAGAISKNNVVATVGFGLGFFCAIWFMVALFRLFRTGV